MYIELDEKDIFIFFLMVGSFLLIVNFILV